MEIKDMSALKLGYAIKHQSVRVQEAVSASLEQIQKQDGVLHAFLEINEDCLRARIQEVETGIRKGIYAGPLAGVPVAVKDNICTKGLKTTCASRILENFVPPYHAEAVERMEKAGMIVIGKTNMDEFAMGSTTETSAFGVTRNPWDTDRVPGGSSGGSCAAVASSEVPLALGSDTGGSIRQPASYCGVVGIKPTYGMVSRYGLIAYASSLDQIGPVGRDVADCAVLLDTIAGYDAKDSTSVKQKNPEILQALKTGCRGMRIGIPEEYLAEGLETDVRNSIQKVMELLKEQGAVIETFHLGLTEYVIPAYYMIACAEASSNLARFDGVKYGYRTKEFENLHEMYKKTRAEGFGEEVKRRIMLGSFVLSSGYYDAYYLKAMRAKACIKKAFDDAFTRYDVLLAPAAPSTAPKLGSSLSDPLRMYLSDIYTAGVNLAGLPAITVPCGLDSHKLPVGVQFISDCFQEKKILRAAYTYEQFRGSFQKPRTENLCKKDLHGKELCRKGDVK